MARPAIPKIFIKNVKHINKAAGNIFCFSAKLNPKIIKPAIKALLWEFCMEEIKASITNPTTHIFILLFLKGRFQIANR